MMKKLLNLSIALCVSMLMFACSDDDKTTDEPTGGDLLCEFSAFGFYADDNEGVITLDYPGVISGANITVSLPESIDKKALKARFTVTEGDVVKVGATIFESGVTPYNYSATVDFIVSDAASKISKVYTVKIQKPVAKVWTEVGKLTKGTYDIKDSDFKMKLNSKDNLPYIVYCVDEVVDGVTTKKLSAAKWTGSAFTSVGSEAFSNAVNGCVDISFDSKGQPYIIYLDNVVSSARVTSVMTYSGAAWSLVGQSGITDKVSGAAIGLDATDKPVIMTVADSKSAPLYRAPELTYYKGDSWVAGGAIPNRPPVNGTSYAAYQPTAKKFGNALYFVVANNGMTGATPNGNSMYKYANGSLTTVIEGGFIEPTSTATNIYNLSFDFASDGTIYFLSADNVNGTTSLRLFTYKEGDSAPKQFGAAIPHDVTRFTTYAVALDKNDTPYLAFNATDADRKLQIMSYDFEQRNWTNPATVTDFQIKTNATEKIFLEFTDDNTGYVGIMNDDAVPSEFVLYKLVDAK